MSFLPKNTHHKTHKPIGPLYVTTSQPKCGTSDDAPNQEKKELEYAVRLLAVAVKLLTVKCELYADKLQNMGNSDASKAINEDLEQFEKCKKCAEEGKKDGTTTNKSCPECQRLANVRIRFWKAIKDLLAKTDGHNNSVP